MSSMVPVFMRNPGTNNCGAGALARVTVSSAGKACAFSRNMSAGGLAPSPPVGGSARAANSNVKGRGRGRPRPTYLFAGQGYAFVEHIDCDVGFVLADHQGRRDADRARAAAQ